MADKKSNKEKSENDVKTNISFFKKIIIFFKDQRTKVVIAVTTLSFVVFALISVASYFFTWQNDQSKLTISFFKFLGDENIVADNWAGKMGASLSNLLIHNWFGISSITILFFLVLVSFKLFKIDLLPIKKTTKYLIFITIWLSVTLGYLFSDKWFYLGGTTGYFISKWFNSVIGIPGTFFLLVVTAFTFIIFVFKDALTWLKSIFSKSTVINNNIEQNEITNQNFDDSTDTILTDEEEEIASEHNTEENNLDSENKNEINSEITEIPSETPNEITLTVERKNNEPEVIVTNITDNTILSDFDPRLELSEYKFPTIELLDEHNTSNSEVSEKELVANKNKIIDTLKNYGIQIDKIKATIGPTVTLYEIVPAPGVKISKIKNLEDDIALSLSALGIRIIAPIPGKGTIGIEVPNLNPEIVSMRTAISSSKFQESKFDLPVTLGKTIQNEAFVFDLTRTPHLLVAGATGQGKSVGLNAIITSLLYKKHPAELKFVLIDPKKIELSSYSVLEKHFLAKMPENEDAIITDIHKVKKTLQSLTIEMDNRYDLLKKAGGVRTIKEYNEKFIKRQLNPNNGHRFLPYIVVVVDEFADLIQTAGREVEDPIARIAQLARAIGIHLIIATQRPSTNIITGSIKANFPSRLAFRVLSMIDSRTILDSPGANQLIGRGDSLISLGGELVRVQCAFIDSPEITKLTNFISEQPNLGSALLLPEVTNDEENGVTESFDPNKKDELFADAAKLIVQNQQGSTSLIQRRFSIGYARAGRIIDQLEAAGIVGPYEGSKARQVLYTDLLSLDQYLNQLGVF